MKFFAWAYGNLKPALVPYAQWLDSIGLLGRVLLCSFVIIFGSLLQEAIHLWRITESNGERLQAISSIVGNAVGIIGAVIAVLITIRYDKNKNKETILNIKIILAWQMLTNGAYLRGAVVVAKRLYSSPSEDDFVKLRFYITEVRWDEFERYRQVFHEINPSMSMAYRHIALIQHDLLKELNQNNSLLTERALKLLYTFGMHMKLLSDFGDLRIPTTMLSSFDGDEMRFFEIIKGNIPNEPRFE